MEALRNEFRWRMVKRKKQVVNLCAAFGFVLCFAGVNNSFADVVASNALPTDPVTVEGSANHTYTDNSLNVGMNTSFVKDTYSSFNIGRDAQVNISGGNTYVAKVLEGGGLSHIYGQLNAAGINVFLQNSSGITFHGSSQVNVGSLLATTASDVLINSSDDFKTIDSVKLSQYGDAAVINEGRIIASDGGFAVLAAPEVVNRGYIQADLGKVALIGAVAATTIDFRGDGLITYALSDEAFLDKASVTNEGTLRSRSGLIHIEASAASDVIESVVNLDGVIDADSFGEGKDGGTVLISSTGDINLNDVTISADGGVNGNGGSVDTWADGINNFSSDAFISAKGGTESGNGGTIEISGTNISLDGDVDASAANGEGGEFIIDPFALTIKDGNGPSNFINPLINTVYEERVEFWSGLGFAVTLDADYLITFEDITDGVISGGAGDITLRTLKNAGGVFFLDKNDKISTTSGDITIEAGLLGIDIGHLETGRDLDVSPGSINLSTSVTGTTKGGHINTKSITVGGVTSTDSTDSTGEVNINAHGNVTIDGQINVAVSTTGDDSNSNAVVDITSQNGDIEVLDDVNIASSASGKNSEASSVLNISADDGNVTVNNINVDTEIVSMNLSSVNGDLSFGNVDILASNVNDANKEVQFSAAEGNITGGNISSDAGVHVIATDTSLLGGNGNVDLSDISTKDSNKAIAINADGNVDTDIINGNAAIIASGDVTTSNIISGSGVSIEGNNVETGHIITDSSSQNVSIISSNDVTTKAVLGNLFINANGNVETGNIKGDVDITAGNNITTKNIVGATDVFIDAGNDVTTGNINSTNDTYIEADNNVVTNNIITGDDLDIIASNDVTTANIVSDDDVYIDALGNVLTKNIISGDDIFIGASGNVTTDNIFALNPSSGKGVDATSEVEIYSSGDVNVNGNVFAGSATTGFGNADTLISIIANKVAVSGNVTATANSAFGGSEAIISVIGLNDSVNIGGNVSNISNSFGGDAGSTILVAANNDVAIGNNLTSSAATVIGDSSAFGIIASKNGEVGIAGDLVANAKTTNGDATAALNVKGENGVFIGGDIFSTSNTINGDAASSINVEASDSSADVDIIGAIAARAFSTNQNAYADVTITAGRDILLSALVPDPLAEANGALVQQRFTGTDSTATGNASLTLDAGVRVRFFDANNFDQYGVHKETGTPYDPNGFDIHGFDINGFDINGFNQFGFDINGIHRDTGTPFGPDGYDQNGFDIAGFDRNGFDINGFDANGFDIAGITS
ncbi:MAG: filamentous hemagglutinin N-terminal domain-containing protein [Rickettsiales bacterium]|nr:filamentous hemagglutinin N-terminal domain-containing protein [Pseudomonadota bacterium]MDA0965349.1 filamentous hemagglutinin N-terminal domain-containing protein [Pseudomonadota bacterium]MDG4544277.1 filamentous hemagglutinin N-terminal domain-containing protein [Rickettsiales bacterium]MDG4544877.1 filamentous hemagglutinin N-terminal domain-containing protein [Rickettsiales bacterium]MDG4547000.1 filamentous hemagglutinin N-terminal domain-containing protein [Rickettsiales bacterium]